MLPGMAKGVSKADARLLAKVANRHELNYRELCRGWRQVPAERLPERRRAMAALLEQEPMRAGRRRRAGELSSPREQRRRIAALLEAQVGREAARDFRAGRSVLVAGDRP